MKKRYIVSALLLGTAMLLAGCGESTSGSGTLRVGVRDDIVNFGYLNPDTGQYYGFEIDLAQELAQKLGYADVEYVTVTPDDRESTLKSGDVDCLVAAYSISEERQEMFDFSPAYYQDISGIVVEKSSMIQDLSGLVGKKIGGLDGANTEEELKAKMVEEGLITDQDVKGTSFKYVESYSELMKELEQGSLDAICMDGCIANAYMDDTNLMFKEAIDTEEYGAATQKDSDLSQSVSDAIQEMLDDGTIDKLQDKWN